MLFNICVDSWKLLFNPTSLMKLTNIPQFVIASSDAKKMFSLSLHGINTRQRVVGNFCGSIL
jgi:hypothetical protein